MSRFEFRPPRVEESTLKSISEDKEARLNIVIPQSMLKNLKRLAVDKNTTLKDLITAQLKNLLDNPHV